MKIAEKRGIIFLRRIKERIYLPEKSQRAGQRKSSGERGFVAYRRRKETVKKRTVKILSAIAAALIIAATPNGVYASANSAQSHWRGVDATGATITGENCPIEVTAETLTFDIGEFPQNYSSVDYDKTKYSAKVTAEYTFYNPTDMDVTATLVFPFGAQPDYELPDEDDDQGSDAYKYDITLDGKAIEKKIRYTITERYGFDLSRDLKRLLDSYAKDDFFVPDTPVTKYVYTVGDKQNPSPIAGDKTDAYAVFDWSGSDGTLIYFPAQNFYYEMTDGIGRFGTRVKNGGSFVLYAIGKPLSHLPNWGIYKSIRAAAEDKICDGITLYSATTTTFEQFALSYRNENSKVSEVDWYNAVLSTVKGASDKIAYGVLSDFGLESRFYDGRRLMRWYEYEITIAPKSSVKNAVTAPIYPAIALDYKPGVYSYTYLLSPASTWAKFGKLDVVVNTPFYITKNSISGFEKTENGYSASFDGLPEGELEFTLCSAENPKYAPYGGTGNTQVIFWGLIIALSLLVLSVICGITASIVIVCVKRRKRRSE